MDSCIRGVLTKKASDGLVVAVLGSRPFFEHFSGAAIGTYFGDGAMCLDKARYKTIDIIQVISYAIGTQEDSNTLFLRKRNMPPFIR